jgi:hypothetical protein
VTDDARAGAAEDADDADDAATDATPRGGSWLTYRYRLGGADTAEASGTIKAPSFLSAARRLVARRLASRLGAEPAYLRLRAAGEEQVLVRVSRGPDGAPRLDVVPSDAYRFGEGADGGAP